MCDSVRVCASVCLTMWRSLQTICVASHFYPLHLMSEYMYCTRLGRSSIRFDLIYIGIDAFWIWNCIHRPSEVHLYCVRSSLSSPFWFVDEANSRMRAVNTLFFSPLNTTLMTTCTKRFIVAHIKMRDYSFYLDRRMSFLEFSAYRQFFTLLGNFVTIILLHLFCYTLAHSSTRSLLQLSANANVYHACVCVCVWVRKRARASKWTRWTNVKN